MCRGVKPFCAKNNDENKVMFYTMTCILSKGLLLLVSELSLKLKLCVMGLEPIRTGIFSNL